MHRSFPARALWSAVALFAAGPVEALTTTSVTLADFQISLTDLTPSDGVAPSVVFDPSLRSSVSVEDLTLADPTVMRQGASIFGAVSLSADLDGTGGAASFSGDPFGAGATITSSAGGNNEWAMGWSNAAVVAPSFGSSEFVLGAHTGITFAGNVSVEWNESSTAATSYAFTELRLWRNLDDGQEFIGDDWIGVAYYGDGPPSGSTTSPLAMTFANETDTPETVVFDLLLSSGAADLQSIPSSVDEPAGAALLLVGVPMLFWRLRRRR